MTSARDERGSAPVDAVISMVLLMVLVLGVVEIAFALYGRNVVAASAHEGARAAIELGRGPGDAVAVATDTVRRSAGGLVSDLDVGVKLEESPLRSLVIVEVTGVLETWGPIPVAVPISVTATASREPERV
ncbi:MAG: TadE/TadG family type IV pilus assembly protein [Actinomycetota bacterium]